MRRLVIGLLVATAALSTANAKITTDASPSASFASYKTYYWAMKPTGISPLMQQRVVEGIDARLQAKGWTLGNSGDVALVANVTTAKQHSLDTFYTGSAMGGWGWRGWGGGMGSATTTVDTYVTGTLIVDMFDASTKQAVWRGTATGTVSSSPDRNTKNLNKDLDKLFAKFPPGSATK